MHDFYVRALADRGMPCPHCGGPRLVHTTIPSYDALPVGLRGADGVCVYCPGCASSRCITLAGFALGRPEVRKFWRAHPRQRALPARTVESEGRAAVVTGFRSVAGHAQIDVVLARDSYEIIAIHTHSLVATAIDG